MELNVTQKFWAVLSENVQIGTVLRHYEDYEDAVTTAQEFAKANVDKKYYVVETVAAFQASIDVLRISCVSLEDAHARGWTAP